MTRANLGFLVSGRGSNMQAIIDACRPGGLEARPALVISNNAGAPALELAARAGVPALHLSAATHPDPERLDQAISAALREHRVDLLILAGYMKKVGAQVVRDYPGRIINIHPALLPAHGGRGMYGMHVHEAVLAAGEQETGATVHLVDEEYDRGPILAQRRVAVLPDDTPATLAARVLAVEHELLVETLGRILSGDLPLAGFKPRT